MIKNKTSPKPGLRAKPFISLLEINFIIIKKIIILVYFKNLFFY